MSHVATPNEVITQLPPTTRPRRRSGSVARVWHWLRAAVPTFCVLVALSGLAVWGHETGWTLPAFSTLTGNGPGEPDDWCTEHGVPESACIECNAALVPPLKDHGWCAEHGVAQCPFDHPDIAQLAEPPHITSEQLAQANRALELRPRAENNRHCTMHTRRIQFASAASIDKAGVGIAIAETQPIIEAIAANGEIAYDDTRTAHLSSRVAGTIVRVEKQVGDTVHKGDVLALIDAAEVGQAKGAYLKAIAEWRLASQTAERLRPLAGGTVAGRQLREAESLLNTAQIQVIATRQMLANLGLPIHGANFDAIDVNTLADRLRLLGIPEETAGSIDVTASSNLFPLIAPLDGVIVERNAVAGEVVDGQQTLFLVADVQRLWLNLDVGQEDVRFLQVGLPVLFAGTGRADETPISGTVSWISTQANERTRTVQVRAELANDDGSLRANTFGQGRIVLRREDSAVGVPSEAVHRDGCCNIVFVRDKHYFDEGAPKFFHVRKVRPGVEQGGVTEIIAGLLPGEVVASTGSVALQSQLLKSNLGAGCGCVGE